MPPEALSPQSGNRRNGPTVILVEDDRDLREAISDSLRLHRMTVLEADSGHTFRQTARGVIADVVILDVNLPDTTGFQLAREVRRADHCPGIIMLTARTSVEDRIEGYREGADLYLGKPVDSVELLWAVHNLTARVSRGIGAGGREANGREAWLLDRVARRLMTPSGEAIALSGRETFLLEQFLGAKGSLVPRETLSAAMGYGAPGTGTRALDAALRRLREKAAACEIALPLSGVQSIGVRFAAPLLTETDLHGA